MVHNTTKDKLFHHLSQEIWRYIQQFIDDQSKMNYIKQHFIHPLLSCFYSHISPYPIYIISLLGFIVISHILTLGILIYFWWKIQMMSS